MHLIVVLGHPSKIMVCGNRSISRIGCILATVHSIAIFRSRHATHGVHVLNSVAVIPLELLLIRARELVLLIVHEFLIELEFLALVVDGRQQVAAVAFDVGFSIGGRFSW